jgi:hypothetical protein
MRLVIRSLVLVTTGCKMVPTKNYVYVYDKVNDKYLWVRETYVKYYPQLYQPAIFHGKSLVSETPQYSS